MRTKGSIVAVVALLVVAAGAWYWASPLYAMSELRDAAVSGDKDKLKAAVDFPAVRDSLKGQISAQLAQQVTAAKEKVGFEALGAALGMAMMGPMIDGLITPEFIASTIKQGKLQEANAAKAEAADAPTGKAAEWKIEREGLAHFRATPEAPAGQKAPTLVFDRDGLGWKLVEIEMPEGAFGSSSPEIS